MRDVIRVEAEHLTDLETLGRANAFDVVGGVGRTSASAGEAVEHAVHDEEHRHLQQQRQARRQRIDLVLLIELHHLFVELLAITAMLCLEPLHLRLQTLHLEHALGALERERGHEDHHGERDQRDREGIVVGQAVELGNEPSWAFEHELLTLSREIRRGGQRRVHNVGNRVVTARAERAAPHESTQSQPQTTGRPVGLERLDRVTRATR